MVSPEQSPLEMQQQSRHELMQSDEGFIMMGAIVGALATSRQLRWAVGIATPVVAAGLLGAWHNASNRVHDDPRVTISAPPAQYKGSFVYAVPEMCFGGYESTVQPKAEYSNKINVDLGPLGERTIDSHYYLNVVDKFDVTNIVCTKATNLTGVWSKDNKDVNIDFTPKSFDSYVFKTNPIASDVQTGHSFVANVGSILSDGLKGLSDAPVIGSLSQDVNIFNQDPVYSRLQGFADVYGFEQATKYCGTLALKDAGGNTGPYAQAIINEIAREKSIAPDHVHLTMPDTLNLTDQYQPLYDQIQKSTSYKEGHLTINLASPSSGCKPSANHNQVITLPANALQPSATPTPGASS